MSIRRSLFSSVAGACFLVAILALMPLGSALGAESTAIGRWKDLKAERPASPSIRVVAPRPSVKSSTPRSLEPMTAGGILTLVGTAGDDILTITMTASGAGTAVIPGSLNVSFSSITQIEYSGNGGADELILIGTGSTGARYTPSASTPGNGTIVVDGVTITFSGLAPVTISSVPSLDFTSPGSNDVVTVDSPGSGENRISGTSGGVAFESATFYDIPTVTLNLGTNDGGSPDDQVMIDSPGLIASSLTSFTVNTGTGNDTLTLEYQDGAFDPHVVTPTAQGAGTIVDFFGGTTDVTYSGIEQIDLQGQLGDGDAFGVDGTSGNDSYVFTTGATADQGTLTGTLDALGTPFTISISFTGMDQDSGMIFDNFSNTGGTDDFTFNAGSDADDVVADSWDLSDTVGSTLFAGLGFGDLATIAINGNDGDDTFLITPGPAAFEIDGGNPVSPATPGDTLEIDPSASKWLRTDNGPGAGQYTFPDAAPVTYTNIESLIAAQTVPTLDPRLILLLALLLAAVGWRLAR